MRRVLQFGALLAFAPWAVAAAPQSAAVPSYHLAESIPGPDGSWDFAVVEPIRHRLYVARGDSVTVLDLTKGGPPKSLGSVSHGHSIVPFDGGSRLLLTSGDDATVRIIDADTGKEQARLPAGKKADASIVDSARNRILVMNWISGTITAIDAASAKVVKTIVVKQALESPVIANNGILFINDEDSDEIETVDLTTDQVGAPIALPGCEGPTGLGYDPQHDRLISACANGKAVILDARGKKVIATLDIGHGADAVIMDLPHRSAYIPAGKDAVLEILTLDGPNGINVVGHAATGLNARTGALDPATGVIYLPRADLVPAKKAGEKPTAAPGTFQILVLRPS